MCTSIAPHSTHRITEGINFQVVQLPLWEQEAAFIDLVLLASLFPFKSPFFIVI